MSDDESSTDEEKHLSYEKVMIDISKDYMSERIIIMEREGWEYVSSESNIFDDNFVNMTFIKNHKKKKKCDIL